MRCRPVWALVALVAVVLCAHGNAEEHGLGREPRPARAIPPFSPL